MVQYSMAFATIEDAEQLKGAKLLICIRMKFAFKWNLRRLADVDGCLRLNSVEQQKILKDGEE